MKNHAISWLVSVVCLCILLCIGTASAFADGPDFSSMSDSDIIAALEQINQEVVSRGIQKTAKLAKGTYNVGKDIPAGSYIYTCLATGSDWGNLTVYSEGGSGKQLLWEIVSAPEDGQEPETVFMTLNEGDQLKSGVSFSLTINAGVLFQ